MQGERVEVDFDLRLGLWGILDENLNFYSINNPGYIYILIGINNPKQTGDLGTGNYGD